MIVAALMVSGALGALLRYRVDRAVQRRTGSDFPLGILVVNLSGSLVLGVLVGSASHHGISASWLTVAGTGLVGAYTTFSTLTFDTVSLLENGEWVSSTVSVLINIGAGLGAAAAGLALGSLI
jgi:CrcB protein